MPQLPTPFEANLTNHEVTQSNPITVDDQIKTWPFWAYSLSSLIFGPIAGLLIGWQNLKRMGKATEARGFLTKGVVLVTLYLVLMSVIKKQEVLGSIGWFFNLIFPVWIYFGWHKKWLEQNPNHNAWNWSILGWGLLGAVIFLVIAYILTIYFGVG